MKKRFAFASLLVLSSASALADDLARQREESRVIIGPFIQQLVAENKKAVMEGGPESAIGVCRDIAPKMSGEISRQNGLRLTRVSLKVRNPLLGTPDIWEQKTLKQFEARLAKGEKPEMLEAAEIVSEPAGKYFRYMKGIVLQPGCVACHGTNEQISDNVKAILATEYPHDQATGYAPGQLRGGVSLKRPM
ncbi:MAG TPA: DUF3365 domain-containing protein [Gallionella sp.]|nr:DUF3365 domain-containing protein [Gallionella sp.]